VRLRWIYFPSRTLVGSQPFHQIGEPRLDSGMAGGAEQRPPFDVWEPLLPQEVCWIIDRSFSLEVRHLSSPSLARFVHDAQMLWHAGNTLAHTVFTCLYALAITEIHPDAVPYGVNNDALRPPQLIPVVLRASICGLLKCCDLSWRELSKGHVHDVSAVYSGCQCA
jgi:hypothetical protein